MLGDNFSPHLRHLLGMDSLDEKTIRFLFSRTDHFLQEGMNNNAMYNTLNGKIVTNLFFEPSTRTRISFEIAAKRLGAISLNPDMNTSATVKGESLLDTVHTFEAMGTDIFIIRHADNNTAQFVASELNSDAAVINGGDGYNEHPTQALLDLYTIQKHKSNFKEISIAIIGDILHSRVARSLVSGLKIMGTKDIRLIAPETLIPVDFHSSDLNIFHSINEGIRNCDVVVALRIQKERIETSSLPDPTRFHREFGLTNERLQFAKPDAIVMHPGPIIRGIEIDSDVADGAQSVILEQVTNGVAIRMAVMDTLYP